MKSSIPYLSFLLFICLLSSCQSKSPSSSTNDTAQTAVQENTKENSVSLDVKLGQMLIMGFRGLTVSDDAPIVQAIKYLHLGGVVLFDLHVPTRQTEPLRNIESPIQVKKLIEDLQSYAEIPLLVTVDQEGGIIRRLKEKDGFPKTVSHQYLGELNNTDSTFYHTTILASALQKLGFNMNLAPVVDVNVNPDNPIIGKLERSFSSDPAEVFKHAYYYINAHHKQKVLTCLKHFPGHGSSTADSHLGLVDVTNTWNAEEAIPYQNLINAKLVDAIMTAHVFNTHLDSLYPATLSKKVITDGLRKGMNYDGVIISDDMNMGAITQHYGFEKGIELAINAGVDILCFGNNSEVYDPNLPQKAFDALKKLVQEGKIPEQRIDESYQRIMALKGKL
ncbi:MAG: glycoside hydrolase family 3 protein [Chitinophagales bacterium]